MRLPARCLLIGSLTALPALWSASAAWGNAIATSSGPDRVAVTVYRDPDRPSSQSMNLSWLSGFAFISEVRQVSIPGGEAEIRFEGVAGGIVPESAIVTGLPEGVIEKNRDAFLLSPASLLDQALGKRVHVRRTSAATGAVTEQEAVIRTGADGAVVLQTAAGFEAMRCTGLQETIVYNQPPGGLSAKPTLSVRTRSGRPVSATVTLSYLASGFDWQANYVATLSPAEDRLDLFAWVTLANGDETGFVNAQTHTVAGRLNRERRGEPVRDYVPPLVLRCWPALTTSDIETPADKEVEEIVVTGQRRMERSDEFMRIGAAAPMSESDFKVVQEELGDLKLYRIPQQVTFASNSQKQVALMEREQIRVETFFLALINPAHTDADITPNRILRMRNSARDGLGLPLPRGQVALFGAGYARPVLIGETTIDDKAVDEDVEVAFPAPAGVSVRVVRIGNTGDVADYLLTVSSDRNRPVRFDAEFDIIPADRLDTGSARLGERDGHPLWSTTIPANGTVTLRYRLRLK